LPNALKGSSGGGWIICGCEEEKDEHGFQRAVLVGLTAAKIRELKRKGPRLPVESSSIHPSIPLCSKNGFRTNLPDAF